MQPSDRKLKDSNYSNFKVLWYEESHTNKDVTNISGKTTKNSSSAAKKPQKKLPLPREIGKINNTYTKVFRCSLQSDEIDNSSLLDDTEDTGNSNSNDSDTPANKFRYCREVIRPYLKTAPDSCPDTEDLITGRLNSTQEDFPDQQPCNSNDNTTKNTNTLTSDAASQTDLFEPLLYKVPKPESTLLITKQKKDTSIVDSKETMGPKKSDADKTGKDKERTTFKLCSNRCDPDSSPICIVNDKAENSCSTSKPASTQCQSTQQCPKTSLYGTITNKLCSTGECESSSADGKKQPKCKSKPKCEPAKPCCPEVKKSLYDVITSKLCSNCNDGKRDTCPPKEFDPCCPPKEPCASKKPDPPCCPPKPDPCCPPKPDPCCPPKPDPCCPPKPDPCCPPKPDPCCPPEEPDPCCPPKPDPCCPPKPKPKPCSFNRISLENPDCFIPTYYSFDELHAEESKSKTPKPKKCTFERIPSGPDPNVPKSFSTEILSLAEPCLSQCELDSIKCLSLENDETLPTPFDNLIQEDPNIPVTVPNTCSYEKLPKEPPDIPKDLGLPCPTRGQGISKQKIEEFGRNIIESHKKTIDTIKYVAEDVFSKVGEKTKEVTNDPEFQSKRKKAEEIVTEYDHFVRDKAQRICQSGAETVEVAKCTADDIYNKICETTEKVQEVCKSTKEVVYELKTEGRNYFNKSSIIVNNKKIDSEPKASTPEEDDNIIGSFSSAISGINKYFIYNDKSSSYDTPEAKPDSKDLSKISFEPVHDANPPNQPSVFSINSATLSPNNLFAVLKEKICAIFYDTKVTASHTSVTSKTSSMSSEEKSAKGIDDEENIFD